MSKFFGAPQNEIPDYNSITKKCYQGIVFDISRLFIKFETYIGHNEYIIHGWSL